MPNGAATKLEAKLGLSSRRKRPPSLPIDPTTGKLDESEVPLDEIQSQFFLLRSDGGVGCRYCSDFLTKEQKRPLYPLRDHVHSVHFKIYPYRCKDCLFETSSYRLSFAHAETMGHRRVIVQRHSAAPLTKVTPSLKRSPEPPIIKSKTKRKSNPLGGEKRSFLGGETQRSLALIENDAIIIEQPDHEVSQETLDQATENDPGADWTGSVWTPNQTRDLTPDQHISSRLQDQPEERPSTSPVDDLTSGSLSPRMEDQDLLQLPYAAPSFLPTPPLIPRIEKEYFRYNIEGLLQCAKCEFRVHSASTDGPGCKKALLEHVYAMHIENLPWTCRDCQFTTKFRSNLNRHCRKLRHAPNSERDAPPGTVTRHLLISGLNQIIKT